MQTRGTPAPLATPARRIVGKGKEETFSRLLDRALLNPEIAAVFLKENNPANRVAMRRRAKGLAWQRGLYLHRSLGGRERDLSQQFVSEFQLILLGLTNGG
ncbi:hypothetical protein [Microvirga sp. P5_D2]